MSDSGDTCRLLELIGKQNNYFCVSRLHLQRGIYQRVPHEDVVIEAGACDVVLLQDVLQPIHTLAASARIQTHSDQAVAHPLCARAMLFEPDQKREIKHPERAVGCKDVESTLPLTRHSPVDVSA